VGNVVEHINPVRRTLNAYNMRGHGDLITFGTDGMPQSMLWAIACGVLHPVKHHRIKLEEAIRHSRDPEGLLVLTSGTYENLRTMNLKKATENREASAAELHNGVVLVARGSKVLHSTL
jgi:hypothetical protein